MRPVRPYLPSCAGFTQADFTSGFADRGVGFNLSNAGDYVYEVGVERWGCFVSRPWL